MTESLSAPTPALTQTNTPLGICEATAHLRQLTQCDLQQNWRTCEADLPIASALDPLNWHTWEIASLNDRQHIAWEKGQRVLWLGHRLIVPSELKGYPLAGMTLRLSLIWWAEAAQVYVNGNLVQEGDLFDCQTRICLSEAVQPGESIDLAIRLVSPGHDHGALVRSRLLYERQNRSLCAAARGGSLEPCPEPGFVADELEVIQTFLTAFAPEGLPEVTAAVDSLPWNQVHNPAEFDRALVVLRQRLLPWSDLIKQRSLYLMGHAHLDLAWLWEINDTWKAAERTFRSALDLQQDYPELIFGHSTPALYYWIETNRPELFAEIRSQIQSGQWEVIAGLWLEPELNLISGESIARHILYGQHYAEEKLGQISRVAWLPDTFGFCWQLPQLLRQGGVEYFVTQKLRWNDTTQFPYEAFWWQSPDGSRILSHHSAPIGEGIDPVKMANYACQWEQNSGQQIALWLPGVGDHGGGPTRDMLELVRRWQQSPFFPNLEFSTAEAFLDHLQCQSANSLPVWQTDLYLEFHRGCYTSHARQKRFNRLSERLLYEAELFCSIASLLLDTEYPQQQIESAWKQVLFNQFHDILPGSAIPEVYEDANQLWKSAIDTADFLKQQALQTIAHHLTLPAPPQPSAQPIVLFNSLPWERSPLIRLTLPVGDWQVWDLNGQPLESAIEPIDSETVCLTFQPSLIPALGYCCVWLGAIPQGCGQRCPIEDREAGWVEFNPESPPSPPILGGTEPTQAIRLAPKRFTIQSPPSLLRSDNSQMGDLGGVQDLTGNTESSTSTETYILENPFLQITIDSQTGDIARLYDKLHQREVLKGAGNQLQAYRDQGQYWDAWNIDPDYGSHPLPPTELLEIRFLAHTPLETRIQAVRRLGQSTFYQTYGLTHNSPILTIDTQVDWQERNTIVKAAFPLNLDAAQATYEIPFGAIDRPTRPQTAAEKAQWEVPALTWADLSNEASDETYGASILSNCKHGYNHQPDQLRLTLLRAPMWPHPDADRGWHEFTYAIYPHSGNWQTAQTVRRGYELTHPIQVILPQPNFMTQPILPPQSEFIKLPADVFLAAFKRSERNPNQWVLRCYEAQGQPEAIDWRSVSGLLAEKLNLQKICESDLLENSIEAIEPVTQFSPWQIKTFFLQENLQEELPLRLKGSINP